MVPFKCDVHNWMSAYVGVLDHPYFAVTHDGGTFELKDLPAGTYTVEAWHEKLGTQTQTVTLGEKESKERDVHVQGAGRRSELIHDLAASLRQARGRLDGAAHRRRRHGDEHRLRPLRAGLAEHLRLVHVLVPDEQDGSAAFATSTPIG